MATVSLTVKFGVVVRRLRTEAGWSQEELAARCGLHRTYIGSIERGEKTVTIETANKLAVALRVALSELIGKVEQELDKNNI